MDSILRITNRLLRILNSRLHSFINECQGFAFGLENPKRRLVGRPFYELNRLESLTFRDRHGRAYCVSGRSIADGTPLNVALVGNWTSGERNSLPFYLHLLFEEGTAQTDDLGPLPARRFRAAAERLAPKADLVIVRANNLLLWKPHSGHWSTGPSNLRMVFDLHPGETWPQVEERMHQSYNLRRLRRSKFTFSMSHRFEDFDLFYRDLYVPLVRSRYKDYGDVVEASGLHKIFKKHGAILLIRDAQGEIVGGGLEYMWRGVLYGMLNGVRGGDPELIKKGALAAWYYFGIQWAFENGFRRFDSGVCEPFLTDGVFIHKSRWGCTPEQNPFRPEGLLLWAPQSAPAALAWLKAHPIHPQFAHSGGPQPDRTDSNLRKPDAFPAG